MTTASVADIILRVIIPESDNGFITIEEICNELDEISYDYFIEEHATDIAVEIIMGGRWKAPIEEFQRICNTYGCEIIGVAHDFSNRYVEAFDLHSDISTEDSGDHYIPIQASKTDENTLLLGGDDENFLEDINNEK